MYKYGFGVLLSLFVGSSYRLSALLFVEAQPRFGGADKLFATAVRGRVPLEHTYELC